MDFASLFQRDRAFVLAAGYRTGDSQSTGMQTTSHPQFDPGADFSDFKQNRLSADMPACRVDAGRRTQRPALANRLATLVRLRSRRAQERRHAALL
jgi:hypothetical protein